MAKFNMIVVQKASQSISSNPSQDQHPKSAFFIDLNPRQIFSWRRVQAKLATQEQNK